MNAMDFLVSLKKLFSHENPLVNALMVLLLALVITIVFIAYAWLKGEMKKKKSYPFRF
jgi:hypothetical protein